MTPNPQAHAAGPVPPIVLFVDQHRDTLERYSRCLESAGLWVAATTVADEAIAAAEEIKPDIVVADADTPPAGSGVLADEFKEQPALRNIPFIVLASAPTPASRADCVLIKPVDDALLLTRTRELLGRAREARARAAEARAHAGETLRRGQSALARSAAVLQQVASMRDAGRRGCPECGARLDWVERGTIGGATYDYYRWCLRGCGLFCFDVTQEKWVRLA